MKSLLILFLAFALTAQAQTIPAKPQKQGKVATTQCKGTTKKGERCKHKTSNLSGYCFQHDKQPKK